MLLHFLIYPVCGKTVGQSSVSIIVCDIEICAQSGQAFSLAVNMQMICNIKGIHTIGHRTSCPFKKTHIESDNIMPEYGHISHKINEWGHDLIYFRSALYHSVGYSRDVCNIAVNMPFGVNKSAESVNDLIARNLYGGDFYYAVIFGAEPRCFYIHNNIIGYYLPVKGRHSLTPYNANIFSSSFIIISGANIAFSQCPFPSKRLTTVRG